RRLQRRDVPLIDTVIGNPVEPNLAVRPRLHASPFDAVVEILGLARREMVDEPGRATAPARIDAHAGIVVRHPFLGIDHFPALIEIARAGGDVGMLFSHALPHARIAVLEREAFGIRAVAQDHRIAALLHWTKYIHAQHYPIVHPHHHIPADAHALPHLAAMLMGLAARRAGTCLLDRSHSRPPRSIVT